MVQDSGQGEQLVGIPVTVVDDEFGNNVFAIDGVQQDAMSFVEGKTYVFDWSGASGHPFRFSTDPDGTHAGGGDTRRCCRG